MKVFLIIGAMLFSQFTLATPVGKIRFSGKVVSYDKQRVKIVTAEKSFEVPRKSIAVSKLITGETYEIALSQGEYYQMRNRYLVAKTNK